MAAACFPRSRRDKDIAVVSLHLRLVPLGAQLGDTKRRRSGVLSSSIDNRRLGPMLAPLGDDQSAVHYAPTVTRTCPAMRELWDDGHLYQTGRVWGTRAEKKPPFRRFDRLRIIYCSPLRGTRFSSPPPSKEEQLLLRR